MKSFINPLLKLLGVILLVLIISLAPELLGGEVETYLKDLFKGYYIIIVSIVFLGALLIYTFWGEGQKFFIRNEEKTDKNGSNDEIVQLKEQIRSWLIESYQKRIDSKMASRQPVKLQLKYSLEGTTTKAPIYNNKSKRRKLIKEELISIFDENQGRLLIVGVPGAGKTTLLLQLAISLLEREKNVVPIIINIATWRKRFNSVEDWLNELLPQIGVSELLASVLIKENRLLPLFDGLDELSEENRKSCLEAIGDYGRINNLQYVICSRIEEYSQTVDAPVYCQIEVRPLTLTHIKKQLKDTNTPESKGMLHAISNDKLLAEAIKIPFYLNATQILFSSFKTIKEFDFRALDLEGRKKEIVEHVIEFNLDSIPYPIEKCQHWLSFLAYEMNEHHLVNFELLDLQYSWNNWTKNTLTFAIGIQRLVNFLVVFLAIILVLPLVGIQVGGLVVIIVLSLFEYKKIVNINIDLSIYTNDNLKWSIRVFTKSVKKELVLPLAHGLVGGLVFGLFHGLAGGLVEGLVFGLAAFLAISLVLGPVLALSIGLVETLNNESYYFLHVKTPYQRFFASAKKLHFSILQHLVLRYQLHKKGLLPFRLVTFLNNLTEQYLFESDGANWRFRHRILQDHFANLWKEKSKANPPTPDS